MHIIGTPHGSIIARWRRDCWSKMRRYAFLLGYGASARKVRLMYLEDRK